MTVIAFTAAANHFTEVATKEKGKNKCLTGHYLLTSSDNRQVRSLWKSERWLRLTEDDGNKVTCLLQRRREGNEGKIYTSE